jgi:methyl-accepting chemotaxis protein
MSIKTKLILLSLLSIAGLVILVVLLKTSINDLSSLNQAQTRIEQIKSDMLILRGSEKNFFQSKSISYNKEFKKNIKHLNQDSKELIVILKENNLDYTDVEKFNKIIVNYQNIFNNLVKKQLIIGMNEDDGLYGKLRYSVQNAEDMAKGGTNYELLSLVYELRKYEKNFMLTRDDFYAKKFTRKINELITNTTRAIKKNLQKYKQNFLELVEEEIKIGLTPELGMRGEMNSIALKSEKKLVNISKNLEHSIDSEINEMIRNSFIIAACIILLVILIAYLISKNIINSIHVFQEKLLSFFKYLNKETQEITMLDDSTKDEIGTMAKVVNENILKTQKTIEVDSKFLDEVQSMIEVVNKGDLTKRFENSVQSENLENLRINFNKMLTELNSNIGKDTNKILDVLFSFGKLDFTNSIENDKGQISTALNEVAKLITNMLIENKSIGLTLKNSSDTLLFNVDTLNKNSTNTAAFLEETAASVEEITGNIRSNTENIIKMSSYANNLNSASSKGQQLANDTTVAMDEINEQVTSINDAIGIIDQISFQTNILSLNAAVEAATAGEAGKGFAVVAQEVRNLASRSAEAAKEIKELVENAKDKANEGKSIADSMISGYDNLNENITSTLTIIEDVEHTSKEQLTGIEQINDAINQLDHQTQENVTIANTVSDIAKQTNEISTIIVSNANDKEFHGKEEVEAKDITVN